MTPMSARILVIGTAKLEHVRRCVEQTTAQEPDAALSLLLHVREQGQTWQGEAAGEGRTTATPKRHYFERPLYALSVPLWRALLAERPDRVVIVCGLYYDHDNVVCAVRSIYNALGRKVRVDVFVQEAFSPAPEPNIRPVWLHVLGWALHGCVAMVLRALSPLVVVRAGEIFSSRIGHLAYDCEVYLCERELGRHAGCFDLFYLKDNHTANATLHRLFARQMRIWPVARVVHDAAVRFRLDRHEIKLVTRSLGTARDPECLIPVTEAHISFSEAEHAQARREMLRLGMPPGVPYVCLLGRDAAYLNWLKPFQNDGNLQEPRNIDINDYEPTAIMLRDAGQVVLRMGSKVKAHLACAGGRILDYATHPARSDLLDVYLSATCRFFIGSGSGLQEVPVIFRVPCVLINCFQLELLQAGSPQNILLPQLIIDQESGRVLRVDEILSLGMGRWGVERFAQSERYRPLHNTPEEIRDAAWEMHSRLDGTWQPHPQDETLQRRFWSLFTPSPYNACFAARIGAAFLRRHAGDLLPEAPAIK